MRFLSDSLASGLTCLGGVCMSGGISRYVSCLLRIMSAGVARWIGLIAENLGRQQQKDQRENVDGDRDPRGLAAMRALQVVFQLQQDVGNEDVAASAPQTTRTVAHREEECRLVFWSD